jgi:hypothetical protein
MKYVLFVCTHNAGRGRPLDEVREIRDMIDERVGELATTKIDAIRSDATSHRWRLAKLLPQRRHG